MEIKVSLGGLGAASHPRLTNIPPSVRQGRPAAASPRGRPAGTSPSRGRGRSSLLFEQVLEQGREKEKAITDMLNTLMRAGVTEGTMPEFDRLNEQLGQVQQIIKNALGRLP